MVASRRGKAWAAWLVLAIVLAAGWMGWPRQPALPAPGNSETAATVARGAAPRSSPAEASPPPSAAEAGDGLPGFLTAEAHATIALIQRGGPFPHRQDGGTFGNREGRLPRKPRGWYREYTVETPTLRHRGARRIVTGGDPPREWYYTDDHYDSFRRFEVDGAVP